MEKQANSTDITNLTYSLGFVMGEALTWVPAYFKKTTFPCPMYVNTNTKCSLVSQKGRVIAVLGELIHPDYAAMTQKDIAGLLMSNWDRRQSEIDKLVGRFVIISKSENGSIDLQTDAIGLRALYFSNTEKGTIAGSHAKLVSQAANEGQFPEQLQRYSLGYPGINTKYANVFRVPPNNSLSLNSGTLKRFFPLEPIPATTIEESWALALSRASQVIASLRARTPVLVSLTAGLDSRTTLAATRDIWDKLDFFTYTDGAVPQHKLDVRVASDIAAVLKLKHQLVAYGKLTPATEMMDTIRSNTFCSHQYVLSCAYNKQFGAHRYVHVRTNLMELGRSNLYDHYGKRPAFLEGPNSAKKMAQFYSIAKTLSFTPAIHSAFIKNFEEADLATALNFASPWDLYFVEHRMGAWQAGVVAESDVAFDTIIAFNSREIVKSFMGVPQEIRASSNHLRERLLELIPEIADIPINPPTYTRAH